MYNARLTGAAPRVQVDDSNLRLLLGGSNPAWDHTISLTLSQPEGGLRVGTPVSLSLVAGDVERARLDVGGLHTDVLTADLFTNLLDTRESTSVTLPPTANALNDAYVTLSNMIVVGLYGGGNSGSAPPPYDGSLLDTYTSTSVLNPPTANALRGAYYNLSNLLSLKLRDLAAATSNAPSSGSGGSNLLDNDLWIVSRPDGAPRFYFATDATTTFAASASAADGYAFRWAWNEMAQDVMRYRVQPEKRLEVLGGIVAQGGAFSACNDATVAGTLAMRDGGSVRLGDADGADGHVLITYSGSNMGVNMPAGSNPAFTLHVNGPVCATESLFTLSDVNAKTDIEPLADPLQAIRHIKGCTYRLKGDASGARHIGVIAQDVLGVAPEAVHEDPSGRLSVAYGNLVALVIEGVKALADEVALLRGHVHELQHLQHLQQHVQHHVEAPAGVRAFATSLPEQHLHYHSHVHSYCAASGGAASPTWGAPPRGGGAARRRLSCSG